MSNLKPFAFVLMPFEDSFNDIYQYGIKKAASDNGIIAERVDEQNYSETILERIYRQIENSDFIIADMSGQNPNVFYEVGFAHAKGKRCILLTKNAKDIPFDLSQHHHIIYDGSASDLSEKIVPKLLWASNESKREKAETLTISIQYSGEILDQSEYYDIASFDMNITITNKSKTRSPEIDSIYIITNEDWTLEQDGHECPSMDYKEDNKNLKKHRIATKVRRLAKGNFEKSKVTFKKTYWSKYSGQERHSTYTAKGVVKIEVSTSEGTLRSDFNLNLLFDDIPF